MADTKAVLTALWVGELDLADPPADLGPGRRSVVAYSRARLLCRYRSEPLGLIYVDVNANGQIEISAAIQDGYRSFGQLIESVDAVSDEAAPGSNQPSVTIGGLLSSLDVPSISVVVGTRRRPERAVQCVRRILDQRYPGLFEVVVVDNGTADGGAADDSTERAIDEAFANDGRVSYIAEERPGLSRARNIGLLHAKYPITAFLSDDIVVDPLWLLGVARGFLRGSKVGCVLGLCLPLTLDTSEQLEAESVLGWGSRPGYEPSIYSWHDPNNPVHPYGGTFFNGSNMAFATQMLRDLGGFDEALGPGTIARGGEDIDAPIRVLASGQLIGYEPLAFGWHDESYETRALNHQLYSYGVGLTAYLSKHLAAKQFRSGLLQRSFQGLRLLVTPFKQDRTITKDQRVPFRHAAAVMLGRIVGPTAYLRSRLAVRDSMVIFPANEKAGSSSYEGRTDRVLSPPAS